jgi:CHAT domain-containing protein/tetratricopeptide (TPR) repeat protein
MTIITRCFLIAFILISSSQIQQLKAQDSLAHYSTHQLDSIIEGYYEKKNYDPALVYAEAGRSRCIKKDSLYAKMCFHIGFYYDYGIGDYDKASDYYNQAFKLQTKIVPTSTDYINTIVKIGELYNYIYAEYDKAEALYLKAKKIYQSTPYSLSAYADVHEGLGITYRGLARYEEAKEACMEACNISQKVHGEKSTKYINFLNSLAGINVQLGAYKKGEEYYLKVLALSEEVLGKENDSYTLGLNNLAILYQNSREYSKVEALYKEAIGIEGKVRGTDNENYASTLNNLAFFYHSLGRYQEAEALYLEAHSINKKVLDHEHPDYGLSLNNLGGLYNDMARFEEAQLLYKEALAINKKVYGDFHPEYGNVLNNLANLYLKQKINSSEVEKMYLRVKKINAHFHGKTSIFYAKTLNNLAFLYEKKERYVDAEEMYKEALDIKTKKLGPDNIELSNELQNLADLYLLQKKYAVSEEYYIRCIKIQEQTFDKKNTTYIHVINTLASLYLQKNDYTKAWFQVQKAAENNLGKKIGVNISSTWAREILDTENISIRQMVSILKVIYKLLDVEKLGGNSDKQIIVSELALQLLKKSKDSFTREKDKLRILKKNSAWVLRNFRVIDKIKNINRAFEIAEQSKSVLLMDLLKTQTAYRFGDLPDSLAQQEKKINTQYGKLKAKLVENRSQEEKDSLLKILNHLNIETQEFKKNVEKKYPKYAAFKYQKSEISIKEIQQQLDEETALIEYVLGPDSMVYIFYIDQQNSKLIEQVFPDQELKTQIKKFHAVLSNYRQVFKNENKAYQKYTTLAYWFYQKLLSPILSKTANIKNLVIITDGELGHLPFEAFLTGEAQQENGGYRNLHYLLNDYQISYNYSASLWKENNLRQNKENNHQLLAMAANYDISSDSIQTQPRLPTYERLRSVLKPLPAAQQEIKALSENFSGFFGFGLDASEKNFKEKAPNYGIIHLAMHGVLDQKNQMLSSLVFTEDNDSLENNFLQAYEISKLNLNADLVVLSACETGYGKFEAGNGIASLARAFMYAGTPSLIVSLWHVNDGATSFIMKEMYQNLTQGMSKPKALSQAKLTYIKNSEGNVSHPAFWSPFIQIGNTQPVHVSMKGGNTIWLIGAGVILLFLGVFAFSRRKKKVA